MWISHTKGPVWRAEKKTGWIKSNVMTMQQDFFENIYLKIWIHKLNYHRWAAEFWLFLFFLWLGNEIFILIHNFECRRQRSGFKTRLSLYKYCKTKTKKRKVSELNEMFNAQNQLMLKRSIYTPLWRQVDSHAPNFLFHSKTTFCICKIESQMIMMID